MYGGGDVWGVEAYLGGGVPGWGCEGDVGVGWVDWGWGWQGDLAGVDNEEEGVDNEEEGVEGGLGAEGVGAEGVGAEGVVAEGVDDEDSVDAEEGVDADAENAEETRVGREGDEVGGEVVWCEGNEGEGDAKGAGNVGSKDAEKSGKAKTAVPGGIFKEGGTDEVKVHGGNTEDEGKASRDIRLGAGKTRQLPATRPGAPLPLQPTPAKTLTIMLSSNENSDDSSTGPGLCACRRQLYHFCKSKTNCSGSTSKDELGALLSGCESCIVSYDPPIVRAVYPQNELEIPTRGSLFDAKTGGTLSGVSAPTPISSALNTANLSTIPSVTDTPETGGALGADRAR